MEAVIRRIRRLTTADSSSKVLVFSTWQDVLEVIAHALRANRLPFAYARGRQGMQAAIRQFKAVSTTAAGNKGGADSVQILLLLVKQGGQGLNLTEAQHVVLVEPMLDPAAEAQVVGRVHRIGQTRPTTVHRFVMDASIEENVCQISGERAATMDVAATAAGRQAFKAEQQSLSIRDVGKLLQQHWTSSGTAQGAVPAALASMPE